MSNKALPDHRITIFANFLINNEERFLRMRDSFFSIQKAIHCQWVVNVRGEYAQKTASFLKEQLGTQVHLSFFSSKKGWFHDTRTLLPLLKTDLIFNWVEDQICLCNAKDFSQLLTDLKESQTEYMLYTFFQCIEVFKVYEDFKNKKSLSLIHSFEINRKNAHLIENEFGIGYIIAYPGIFSIELFKKITLSRHPYLKRWPKECPFDWEKTTRDKKFLPIRVAEPKMEFFASIDDDLGAPGYSLISRGAYPNRVPRSELIFYRNTKKKWHLSLLKSILPSRFYRFLQRVSYHF